MDVMHKIVAWVMSPMGFLFLGLGCAFLLRRFRKASRLLAGAVLAFVWLLGCGITTRLIGVPLEGREFDVCEQSVESLGRVDVIVLLGGGMGVHEKCGRSEMFAAADRVWMAARLWKHLAAQGGEGKPGIPLTISGNGAPAELEFLMDVGVKTNDVVILKKPKNTEDEAREIAAALKDRVSGCPRALLVTSAWHMPRASMLFRRVGFDIVEAPADFEMTYAKEGTVTFGDFFPNAAAMERNAAALKEWVARACYAIKRR